MVLGLLLGPRNDFSVALFDTHRKGALLSIPTTYAGGNAPRNIHSSSVDNEHDPPRFAGFHRVLAVMFSAD